jgi:U3 small nucleolar RNA-associated protein 14
MIVTICKVKKKVCLKISMREKPNSKRKKKLNFDVYKADDAEEQASKLERRRGGGGGGAGNNYDQVGSIHFESDKIIDSEDDDEITEEDAFNEEDEEKFGLFFKSEEVQVSEEDEFLSDAHHFLDLSEMLAQEEESEEAKVPAQKKIAFLIPSEGEASSSERDGEDFEFSESEEEKEVDLTSIVDGLGPEQLKKRKRIAERTETFEESEFQSNGIQRKKLGLNDLMGAVADETSFGDLKRQLGVLSQSDVKTVSAPLAPRLQNRVNRSAAREETEKNVSKWIPIVKKNREAETLSFPMNEAPVVNLSSGALVGKFEVCP